MKRKDTEFEGLDISWKNLKAQNVKLRLLKNRRTYLNYCHTKNTTLTPFDSEDDNKISK